MSAWTKFRDKARKVINAPLQYPAKYVFQGVRAVTGSEKFAASIVSGGDPFTLFGGFDPKFFGAKDPTLFRKGVQAGRATTFVVSSLFVGGALAGGGSTAVEGSGAVIAGGAETSVGSLAAYDAALAAGAAEGVGTVTAGSAFVPVAATSGGFFSTLFGGGTTSTLLGAGLLSSLFGGLKKVGEGALTSLIEREGKDIFQGGSDSTTTIPGSGSDSGIGSFLGSSYLPIALIVLTLIGAFILTRKKRRK
jgi:hypothetical protein